MKSYDAARAQCPYFERCGEKKIVCEDAADGVRCAREFTSRAERDRFLRENCESTAPGACRYRLLLDELYERGIK